MVDKNEIEDQDDLVQEFNTEEVKELYRIDELDNLYEHYYNQITLDDVHEYEKVCGTIYMCMKTASFPVIYGEFDVYENVNSDNVKRVVQNIEEEDEGYEVGELSEQTCWDYVFFDLNNNNITAHAENFAQQLVDFYNKADENEPAQKYKEILDSFEPEVGAIATMFMYRNVSPSVTGPANHVTFEDSPYLIGSADVNEYEIIDAYHEIYQKCEYTPAVTFNHLDNTGVFQEAVNVLDELDLTEEKRDSIMYILYQINYEVADYDHRTVAIAILGEYTNISKQKLLDIQNISEAQYDRIKNKLDFEAML